MLLRRYCWWWPTISINLIRSICHVDIRVRLAWCEKDVSGSFYLVRNVNFCCPIQFIFLQFGEAPSIYNSTRSCYFLSNISHTKDVEVWNRYATRQYLQIYTYDMYLCIHITQWGNCIYYHGWWRHCGKISPGLGESAKLELIYRYVLIYGNW